MVKITNCLNYLITPCKPSRITTLCNLFLNIFQEFRHIVFGNKQILMILLRKSMPMQPSIFHVLQTSKQKTLTRNIEVVLVSFRQLKMLWAVGLPRDISIDLLFFCALAEYSCTCCIRPIDSIKLHQVCENQT